MIAVDPLIVIDARELHCRIEGTVLITGDGAEVLSVGLPTEVDELLALVGSTPVQGDALP